jgi:hypothetical protein
MTTYEPFIAAFTGKLTTWTSTHTKLTYTFNVPYPTIKKGQAYMMELDKVNNRIKMIPVVG